MLFNQSVFLQSLGWAIANSLWQMALLWLTYQNIFAFNKKASSNIKNLSGTILLLGGFSWFIITAIDKAKELSTESSVVILGDANVRNYITDHSFNQAGVLQNWFQQFFNAADHYLPYLSIAYLLILVALTLRLVNAFYISRNLKHRGLHPISENWNDYFKSLVMQIGISRNVQLWLSEKISVPGTLGFLKPIVLLPIASINQLSTEQLEAIILHELAHIRRWDYLWNLLITIADTVLFFNPFAHLLYNICCRERENCCDDVVISYRQNPEVYVSALLSLEKNRVGKHHLAIAATSGKYQLLDRVKRILNVPQSNFNYGQRLIALVLTAGALSSLAWLVPEKTNTAKQEKQSSEIALLQKKSLKQIEIQPATVEKDKKGNLVLMDSKKQDMLIVKPEKQKIKIQNKNGKVEFIGDRLELKEPLFPREDFQRLPAIAEQNNNSANFKEHPFAIAGQLFKTKETNPASSYFETLPLNMNRYFGQVQQLMNNKEKADVINNSLKKAEAELLHEKEKIKKELAGKNWEENFKKLKIELDKNNINLNTYYDQMQLEGQWAKELNAQMKQLEMQWKEDSVKSKEMWNGFFQVPPDHTAVLRKRISNGKNVQYVLSLNADGNFQVIAVVPAPGAGPETELKLDDENCTCQEVGKKEVRTERKRTSSFNYKYKVNTSLQPITVEGRSLSRAKASGIASAETRVERALPRVRILRNDDRLIEVVLSGDDNN